MRPPTWVAEVYSLWVAQGIDQICLFVKSWRANNIAGQFLRVALAWAQHNSGVGTPILEIPTIPIPYLETQWISSLRTALTSLGCKIQVDYSSVYPLQRQHDAHLMDVFREHCTFKPNELKSLNQCRLFLQVMVVSDICDASGRAISSKDYFDGVLSTIQSRDIAAVQERPVALKTWSLWKRALTILVHNCKDRILGQPLGVWLHQHCHLKQQWPALYSAGNIGNPTRIFLSVSRTVYIVCAQCPDLANFYETDQHTTAIPADSVPVDIVRENNVIQKRRTWPVWSVDPLVVEGLAPWKRNLEPWQRDLVSHTSATKTHHDTAFELSWTCRRPEPPRSSSVWPALVCDGSVQRDQGTFGWVLAHSSGVVLSTGQEGPAYGHDITSYRAEAYGMLSGILYVNKILQFYQPRQDALTSSANIRNIRIVCDNEGLITAIRTLLRRKRSDFVNETIGPEWDVIQAIVQAIRELGTVAMIHFKGHQDEGNTNRRLPLLARLNMQADKLATSFQRHTNHRSDAAPCSGGNYAQLHATPPSHQVP
jgi:hypothetical protein